MKIAQTAGKCRHTPDSTRDHREPDAAWRASEQSAIGTANDPMFLINERSRKPVFAKVKADVLANRTDCGSSTQTGLIRLVQGF